MSKAVNAAPHSYEFGQYRLDLPSRRLLRGGDVVSLTPKAFDILVALIERRDRVVDKAELMQIVWPDSFVEEANLSQTIFVLRKTLGDEASGRPFIDTVPRRGYRFAAEVRQDAAVPVRPPAVVWGGIALSVAVAVALALAWWTWSGVHARPDAADVIAGKKRIVVLPFENLTRDRNDDWLASAFSDSLTFGLQGLDDVICVSRDRIVELYRQQSISESAPLDGEALRRLSQAFGVSYYVQGTYQRLGDRIRVTARLVDHGTGEVRAQESVTDEFAKLLEVEDDLANRFGAKLEAGRQVAASRPKPFSLEAYQAVVEARTAYAAGNPREAMGGLQRAVQLDPGYAEAWALLSKTTARLAASANFVSGSPEGLHQSALTSARQAVSLAPSLYEAHTALALAYREAGQVELWRREAETAIALNPRLAEGYELLADWYAAMTGYGCSHGNDPALAETYFRTALGIDPRFAVAWGNLTYHLQSAGQFDEAMRVADEAAKTLPESIAVRRARASALLFANRPAEAEQELLRLPENNRSVLDRWILASVALLRGDEAGATREFDEILHALPGTNLELSVARSYFLAHHPDQALVHLDRAVALNHDCARFAASAAQFAPYRDTPAFRAHQASWN
ncbi:MAG: tetratricopeptide repeat protein [Vicinamibacterales bacterium]